MVERTETPSAACWRVRGRLDEGLDGALAPLEAARDEGHLEACRSCAALSRSRREALAGLRELLLPDPAALAAASRGLEARLRTARMPRAGRGPRGRAPVSGRTWQRPLRAAAVAASALLMLGLLQRWSGLDVAGGVLGARSAAEAALPEAGWPVELGLFAEDE